MIYLDNAATTYPKPKEVLETLDKANRNAFNTGRGSYKVAREASKIKEETRNKIISLNNFQNSNVIYSNSATNALNDIIFGLNVQEGDYIYISPFEHNSIVRPLYALKKELDINIEILPFNKENWEPDLTKINDMFTIHNPRAIFISQVSNVTGYKIPYDEIFELGKKYKSFNILDSSQSYGIVPIKKSENIDFIVFAGHKSLYSSFGIAGYIKLSDLKLKPHIFGGTGSDTMNHDMPDNVPDSYEAGSPNIVAICGLSSAIDWIKTKDIYKEETELTKYLINELLKIKKVQLFIPENYEEKIFGVVSIGIQGYSSDDVGCILDDEFDICVRTGYHCAPFVHDFIDSKVYNGTVRISLSYFTTKDEIDSLIKALKSL